VKLIMTSLKKNNNKKKKKNNCNKHIHNH